jgi:hypothetical protein
MNKELEQFIDISFKRELFIEVTADPSRYNRTGCKYVKLIAKLDKEKRRGELRELLSHPDPFVRCEAAAYMLEVDEDAAKDVLRKLKRIRYGQIGMIAGMKILWWDNQRHGIPMDFSSLGSDD